MHQGGGLFLATANYHSFMLLDVHFCNWVVLFLHFSALRLTSFMKKEDSLKDKEHFSFHLHLNLEAQRAFWGFLLLFLRTRLVLRTFSNDTADSNWGVGNSVQRKQNENWTVSLVRDIVFHEILSSWLIRNWQCIDFFFYYICKKVKSYKNEPQAPANKCSLHKVLKTVMCFKVRQLLGQQML